VVPPTGRKKGVAKKGADTHERTQGIAALKSIHPKHDKQGDEEGFEQGSTRETGHTKTFSYPVSRAPR